MAEKEYRAKDFMTKYVFSVPPNITIHELIRLFVSHNVGTIPVVDTDNTLLGIVSEGDLLYKKVRPYIPQYVDILGGTLYYCGYGRYEKSFRKLLATEASEIMTREVRCVTPETEMSVITTLMVDEHLKSVPVVSESNKLVGIITRHDILTVLALNEKSELEEADEEEAQGSQGKE